MRKVYVCSPLRADTKKGMEENRLRAIEYCKMAEAIIGNPDVKAVAPHAYLPLLLDDNDSQERELALRFGKELLALCEAMFVCGEVISDGMKGEITVACHIPIIVQQLSLLADVKAIAPKICTVMTVYELIYGGARRCFAAM